jgi:hypothetical protein
MIMATPSYMTTNDADLVRLIKNGAIFIRRVTDSPTAPTGTDWTPGVGDGAIGYYSDDGFTMTPVPGESTVITGHNGDDVVDEQGDGHWEVGFNGLEANESNAEAYFDVEVGVDGSITLTSAAANTRYDLVCVGLDQSDRIVLAHFPNVKVSEREAMTFNRTTLMAYGMTFRTFLGDDSAYHVKVWGAIPDES